MHLIKNFISNPLNPIRISLIGCGGTGSYVLEGLAKLNIAHQEFVINSKGLEVTVYDPDTVTETNIARQQFYPNELGDNKAIAKVTEINRKYGYGWKAKPKLFESLGDYVDVIIICVDNMDARRKIYSFAKHYNGNFGVGIYVVDFGNGYDYGQVFLSYFSRHENFEGFPQGYLDTQDDENEPSCSLQEALSKQKMFVNPVMASYGLDLIYDLLLKSMIKTKGVYVSLENYKSSSVEWIDTLEPSVQ